MHRDVAFTGGAALAAGLLLGLIVDRLVRVVRVAPALRPGGVVWRQRDPGATPQASVEAPPDVLERFRAAAAF
jgi:hypothetical protein